MVKKTKTVTDEKLEERKREADQPIYLLRC